MMRVSPDDIRWLQEILLGHEGTVPAYEQSRLVAMQMLEHGEHGLIITPRGQEAIAEYHRNIL
jgi:hypothetical protein